MSGDDGTQRKVMRSDITQGWNSSGECCKETEQGLRIIDKYKSITIYYEES